MLRLIARLGGFLGRKADGEPGLKPIWLGLQRVTDFAAGVKHAGRPRGCEKCVRGWPMPPGFFAESGRRSQGRCGETRHDVLAKCAELAVGQAESGEISWG
jgi:hypothetical protein